MNDQQILELLRLGKRDKALLKLYKDFPKIEKFILSKGGSKEDAKDIFQEALIIFYNKATDVKFELTSAIGTYLYSVSRFLWKDELQKRNKNQHQSIEFDLNADDENELLAARQKEARLNEVEKVLMSIGEKCLLLLKLFYYEGLKMKEIAAKVGLKSEKVAKNQKYKCLERAKLKLKEQHA